MRRMGQGGGVVRLVGVMTVRKKGRAFHYYRKRGQKLVPLPNLPFDHPDFLKAYAEAKANAEPLHAGKPGTLSALLDACHKSEAYRSKSDSYRSILNRHFVDLRRTYGGLSYAGLQSKHIAADVKKASAPDHRHKAWRFLCAFAIEAGFLEVDPSQGAPRPKRPPTDGHEPWTAEEIAAYRKRWPIDTVPRRSMELLYWTGARISDGVLLGRGMIDRDGILSYRQTKTGDMAHAPWSCPLPDYAKDMEADREAILEAIRHAPAQMTFLATHHGKTRSAKALGTLIRESASEAGVKKSAHGLRKSRAIILAESGGTPHQISAWTGHKTLSEVERYTRKANRRKAVMGTEQDQNGANHTDQSANRAAK